MVVLRFRGRRQWAQPNRIPFGRIRSFLRPARPNTGVATLLLLFITFPARQPFRASNHVPEFILASPKVILDLSGSHFGAVVSGAIVCGYYGEWCYGEWCYGEWVL